MNILAAGTQPDDLMYRDSCLTHLLQQSLGGNAKLSVICTISPDIKYSFYLLLIIVFEESFVLLERSVILLG